LSQAARLAKLDRRYLHRILRRVGLLADSGSGS
jgi:hypothetical protein